MVWPLLLGGLAVAGTLGVGDKAGDIAADTVSAAADVIGPALVSVVEGTYDAVEEAVEGRGVEVATALTCIFLAWATYHAARNVLAPKRLV